MELDNIGNGFSNSKHTYEVNSVKKSMDVDNPEESNKGLKEPCLKSRHLVLVLTFMANLVYYYQQITVSVSLGAMVNQSSLMRPDQYTTANSCAVDNMAVDNSSSGKTALLEGEFSWSPKIQGYLLMSSFLGYMIFYPIYSKLGEIYGGKRILFWSLLLASIFSVISPFAARWNVYVLIVIQCLRGMSQAGILPSSAILTPNWFPKQERGFAFSCVISGVGAGAFLGSILSGVLCDTVTLGGWPSAFYVSGILGFIVAFMVLFLMYDNPSVHPRISQAEREYIFSNQENILTEKRPKTPWKEILTSVPVYALAYGYFGQVWAISYVLSINPTYLKTILHFSTEKSGYVTSLTFTSSTILTIVCSYLSKFFVNRNYMTVDQSRKFWNSLSVLGVNLCLLGIYFAECNTNAIIILCIVISICFGPAGAGCGVACTDMSPTFAASVNSVAVTFGSIAYLILPVVVGYLTDGAQTMEQWHKIFIISIVICVSAGLVFAIFGSATIQPWNDVPKSNTGDTKENNNCKPE